MVEVQCTSCHTRYRVDEQVLPEGTPTFKCSRCGHVFTIEPRAGGIAEPPPARTRRPSGVEAKRQEPSPDAPRASEAFRAFESSIADEADSRQPESSRTPSVTAASTQPAAPPPAAAPLKPVSPKISTAELLSRPFVKAPEAPAEGENLAFDFNDEHPALEDDAMSDSAAIEDDLSRESSGKIWAVGDEPQPRAAAASDRFEIGDAQVQSRSRKAPPSMDDEFVDEGAAPVYNRGVAHSARFFLGLLLFVFIGFAGTTMTIHAAPAAARGFLNQLPIIGDRFISPLTPARMVALREVHSGYQLGKDGKAILVIAGQAENVSARPLHAIGIAAALAASAGKAGARREVYCGNNLVSRTIAEMTSHEIDFFQGLPPPPSFSVDPSSSCPFVIVFTGPLMRTNHFALSVTRADMAGSETAAPAS
jgi:predicted Zn finger-like uncharacterized protein